MQKKGLVVELHQKDSEDIVLDIVSRKKKCTIARIVKLLCCRGWLLVLSAGRADQHCAGACKVCLP